MKKIPYILLFLIVPAAVAFAAVWFARPQDVDFDRSRAATPNAEYSKFAEVNSVRVHYQEKGSGPVLVLLHGNGASTYTWKDVFHQLSTDFRVIAIDLMGFGFSGKPEGDYSMPAQAAFVMGLLDELKIDRAVMCGNSMGGAVSLMCAINYPERVEGLILLDSAAFNEFRASTAPSFLQWPIIGPAVAAVALRSDSLVRKGLEKCFVDKSKVTDERVAAYHLPLTTRAGQRAAYLVRSKRDNSPVERSLDKVKQPTLIIWGDQDAIIPLDLGKRLHERIPGSEFVVLENCGHVPQEEMPERVLKEAAPFLSRFKVANEF